MIDLGKILQQRREELGLDLEELQERTKIRIRYLAALEAGDWTPLPGDVYARGFVRSYAEQLGLDGRELLERYVDAKLTASTEGAKKAESRVQVRSSQDNSLSPGPTDRGTSEPRRAEAPVIAASGYRGPRTTGSAKAKAKPSRPNSRGASGRSSRGYVGQTIAVIAMLGLVGAGLYYVTKGNHNFTSPSATEGAHGGSGTNAVNVGTGNHTHVSGRGNQSGTVQGHQATGTPNPPTTSHVSSTKPVVVSSGSVSGNTVTYLVQNVTSLHVVISATERLWTQVLTQDGQSVNDPGGYMLSPGQSKAFMAKQEITFKVGNVPGARFVVNGQTIQLPNVTYAISVTFRKSA